MDEFYDNSGNNEIEEESILSSKYKSYCYL